MRRVRRILVWTGILVAYPALFLHGQTGDTLRIGLVLPDSSRWSAAMGSAARGVEMGVEEAARSASLLRSAVRLERDSSAARLVSGERVQALIGGFSPAECRSLAATAQRLGVIFVDVGCADDALRGAECRPSTLHVAASEAMRRDALAASAGGGEVVEWDARLERFGADQLNQRFRARQGVGMDSQGWAGWFAVKMLWESSLRARTTAPAALLVWVRSDAAQFDGHKGRPLSIRAWDGQLRQPLYLVRDTLAPVEVPPAAPGDSTSSRDLLDRLGTPATSTRCHFDG
jgi:hypothetical protein